MWKQRGNLKPELPVEADAAAARERWELGTGLRVGGRLGFRPVCVQQPKMRSWTRRKI